MLAVLRLILLKTYRHYVKDRVPLLAAALSFYTLFSLAPLFLVSVGVAGALYGDQAAEDRLYAVIRNVASEGVAQAVESIVEDAQTGHRGALPAFVGLGILLVGASVVFTQLKSAMNAIWGVQPLPSPSPDAPSGFRVPLFAWLRTRVLAFGLVLGSGLLLFVSILATSVLHSGLQLLDSGETGHVLRWSDAALSLGLVTLVFGLLFKYVPDVEVDWRAVWIGAVVTSLLFNVGKFALSAYLGQSAVASSYGAAGSVVVILLWVYFACQVFFIGAELTQVLSERWRLRSPAASNVP